MVKSGNNIVAMRKRTLSLLIAVCMLAENAAAFGMLRAPDISVSAPVIQAGVFQLISLVRLPFTLASELIAEENPLTEGLKRVDGKEKRSGKEKNKKSGNGDGFISAGAVNEAKPILKSAGFGQFCSAGLALLDGKTGILWVNLIFYWLGFKYIFLLACLAALSKSNLPWGISYSCV